MAIEVTTGRVEYLKIGDDFGFVAIRRENKTGPREPVTPPSPATELLIIWFGSLSQGPKERFTTELSNALSRGLRVRLSHEDDSAYISQLIVDAPFEGALV